VVLRIRYNKSIFFILGDKLNFEFDENKSCKNKEKHKIDFKEAQELWNNENALIIPANIIDNEVRYAIISKLNLKCYVGIFTIRENNYRIISVRRCRKNEEKNYENNC
jgi:uncharacterized DUF497 family protein